jgi:hypothetical protein
MAGGGHGDPPASAIVEMGQVQVNERYRLISGVPSKRVERTEPPHLRASCGVTVPKSSSPPALHLSFSIESAV